MAETLTPTALAGAWQLRGVKVVDEDGNVDESPFGASPTGQITYTEEGHMSVVIRREGDQPGVGYAGAYTVGDGTVTHDVYVGLGGVSGPQLRYATLEGDILTLRTGPDGGPRAELRWQRSPA
jgi:hypothetical protein